MPCPQGSRPSGRHPGRSGRLGLAAWCTRGRWGRPRGSRSPSADGRGGRSGYSLRREDRDLCLGCARTPRGRPAGLSVPVACPRAIPTNTNVRPERRRVSCGTWAANLGNACEIEIHCDKSYWGEWKNIRDLQGFTTSGWKTAATLQSRYWQTQSLEMTCKGHCVQQKRTLFHRTLQRNHVGRRKVILEIMFPVIEGTGLE